MVKFEFEVTDNEAELLFDLVQSEIARRMSEDLGPHTHAWRDGYVKVLEQLKGKMHNRRV